MQNYAVLSLLFGSAIAGKIPLTRQPLSMENILHQKEQLEAKYFGAALGENVPITDYMNT